MPRLQSRGQREVGARRRGLDHCARLTSTNDGAPWIERVIHLNFPDALYILDWTHATEHVWPVAHDVYGEHTPAAH